MNVLVTAGPTYEPIDPVRFIGNRSTGKMGIAIADEFARHGDNVVLVKGPTHLHPQSASVREVPVHTAEEMFHACAQYFDHCEVIVFAAAVADYKPKHPSALKMKKGISETSIELIKTKDIAASLGKQKKSSQIIIGFALETDREMEHALEKLQKKNMDMIVLNSIRDAGAGFGYDTNKVTLIDKDGNVTKFELKAKTEVAKDIVAYARKMLNETK